MEPFQNLSTLIVKIINILLVSGQKIITRSGLISPYGKSADCVMLVLMIYSVGLVLKMVIYE